MISKFLNFYFLLALPTVSVNALNIIANLDNSLDIKQVQKCEKHYEKVCAVAKAKNLPEEINEQLTCIKLKMKHDKLCNQAYIIRDKTNYPPTKMKNYPKGIVVFTTTTLADGQTEFYIVDSRGKIFGLASDENLMSSRPEYMLLKKNYPELTITTFVFWSKLFEDQFPEIYHSDNGEIILSFKQEIRDGPCVACAPVAIAKIAYVFKDAGDFSAIKLLKIESLPLNFKR